MQRPEFKSELHTGKDHQRFEMPGSGSPTWEGSNSAMLSRWVAEKASCIGLQSPVAVVQGDEVCRSELASRGSILWPYVPPAELPIPVSHQQRSSPELRHPIHSQSDRDSLFKRIRGTPAADRRRSDAYQYRNSPLIIDDADTTISSSSSGSAKPDGYPHIVPNHADEVRASFASSEDLICLDESNNPYQSCASVQPWSHAVSPDNSAPTADFLCTDLVSPSSPKLGHASLPPDTQSPISPIVEYVDPLSTNVSPATVTCDGSSAETTTHHKGAPAGWFALASSPLLSTPEELNITRSPFTSIEPRLLSSQPVYERLEFSMPQAQQTEDKILKRSLNPFRRQYQSDNSDTPPLITQPHSMRTPLSDSDGSIYLNRTPSFNESFESDPSSSIAQSVVTQVEISRSDNDGFWPIVPFSASSPQYPCMESSFQSDNGILSPPEPTRPTVAPQILFSRPLNHGTTVVTDCTMQHIEIGDTESRKEKIKDMERSGTREAFSFPDLQLQSPLDSHEAKSISGLHSISLEMPSSDGCRQIVPQRHSRDSTASQALLVKTLPHCFNHSSFLVSNSAPRQRQVAELQELIRIVNSEWMQRIKPLRGLWSLCKALSASGLFERAVRTLRDFSHGRSAQNFEGVFAMMHLVFAAAFSLHWQQDFYRFSVLCEDAFQWQHVLSSDEDKTRFLNAMNCWRLYEFEPTTLANSSCHTSFDSSTLQGSLYCADLKTVSNRLRNGEVFKVCTGFLDGKSAQLHSENIL